MSINLISVKCPECNATLDVEEGRKQLFCSYCGARVIIQNENEYIYRHIDEAKIKQAEMENAIRLRELELDEMYARKYDRLRNILLMIWIPLSIIIVAIGLGIMFFGGSMGILRGLYFLILVGTSFIGGGAVLIFKLLPEKEYEKALLRKGGIILPSNIFPLSEKNYEDVDESLRRAGFKNIKLENLHDIIWGLFQKPGIVESISIDGNEISSGGIIYSKDAEITITYHGK